MITGRTRSQHPTTRARQRGVILIVALIFMTVLGLLVLAGMRTGLLQERMASNARNRQVALQSAEAMLRDAEVNVVRTQVPPFDPFVPTTFVTACTNGFCARPEPNATPRWQQVDWSSTSVTRSFASSTSNLSTTVVPSQPRYIVELVNTPIKSPSQFGGFCPTVVSRLTSKGTGFDSAEVYVQSMYRTRPKDCP
jgi:type IV pilus assembly protein PilX